MAVTLAQIDLELTQEFLGTPEQRAGFLLLAGLLGGFLFIRTSARMIRHQVSWWPGNVQTSGGLHLHHLVWGICGIMATGFLMFAFQPDSPWVELLAVLFGIGCGLTLDEFALWIHLEDVYWTAEGRSSVDAVVVAVTIGGLVVVGAAPFGDAEQGSVLAIVLAVAANLAFVVVVVAKGKLFTAVVGAFVPLVALVGAIRLGRPGSRWAKRRYEPGSRKLERATARAERVEALQDRVLDFVGGTTSKTLVVALLAFAPLTLALAPGASASPRQLSIVQDDATFVYAKEGRDPEAAIAEAKAIGADMVRVFLTWHSVSPNQNVRVRPPDFDVSDPDSSHYSFELYDALIERAREYGMKVLITIAPPIPWWASEQPGRCPHRIGGYSELTLSCMWKPSVPLFAQFVRALVRRYGTRATGPYGGQVALWSFWNEPNLEHYLVPQERRTRFGKVDLAARRYRELWIAGWREIARYDPPSRNRVLFGDTAAISSPMDTLYAALCLDDEGRPFRGRLRRLQGCRRPRRLPIAGLALHPYNSFALGSVYQRTATTDSLPMAYLGRAHELLDRAARFRRIPRRRLIHITEFGFQSSPPNPRSHGLPPRRHAAALNQAERLFYGDRRIRSVAQYELFDPPTTDVFNTGLRLADGRPKPALRAYRMPLVVTRLSRNRVEVWGQVRPAEGRVRPEVRILGRVAGRRVWRPLTNPRGFFRFEIRHRRAPRLRYRATWTDPDGDELHSRVARPGRPIRYRE